MAFDSSSSDRTPLASTLSAATSTSASSTNVAQALAGVMDSAASNTARNNALHHIATAVPPLNGGRSLTPHPKKELFESTRHGTSVFPFASYLWVPQDFPSRVTLHWHRETELVRFTKGTFKVSIDMQDMVIKDDAFLLLPGNVMHTISLPAFCEESAVVFDPKMLLLQSYDEVQSEIFESLLSGNMPLPLVITPSHPAFARIDELYNYCAHHGATTHASLRLKIKTKLLEILSIYHQYGLITRKDAPQNIKRTKQDKLKELLNYIDSHYAGPMSIKDASSRLGVTDQYFCRFFKRVTGMSFTEYLNDLRLRRAAKEIELSSRAISDIAYEHGFENAGYFFKSFKSKYGITPLKYRKRFRTDPEAVKAAERAIIDEQRRITHQANAESTAEVAAEMAAEMAAVQAASADANTAMDTLAQNEVSEISPSQLNRDNPVDRGIADLDLPRTTVHHNIRGAINLPLPDFTLQNPLMPPLNGQETNYLLKLASLGLYTFASDPDDSFEEIGVNYGNTAARRAATAASNASNVSQNSSSDVANTELASSLGSEGSDLGDNISAKELAAIHNNSISSSNGYNSRENNRNTWTPSSGITEDYLRPVPNEVSINTAENVAHAARRASYALHKGHTNAANETTASTGNETGNLSAKEHSKSQPSQVTPATQSPEQASSQYQDEAASQTSASAFEATPNQSAANAHGHNSEHGHVPPIVTVLSSSPATLAAEKAIGLPDEQWDELDDNELDNMDLGADPEPVTKTIARAFASTPVVPANTADDPLAASINAITQQRVKEHMSAAMSASAAEVSATGAGSSLSTASATAKLQAVRAQNRSRNQTAPAPDGKASMAASKAAASASAKAAKPDVTDTEAANAKTATPQKRRKKSMTSSQQAMARRAEIRAKIDELEIRKQFNDLDI